MKIIIKINNKNPNQKPTSHPQVTETLWKAKQSHLMFFHVTDILHILVSTPCTQSHLAQLPSVPASSQLSKPFDTNEITTRMCLTTSCHRTSATLPYKSFPTRLQLVQRKVSFHEGCDGWAYPSYKAQLSLIEFKSVR